MAATLGPIYGTAATNVATDNFAKHLNLISERISSRLTKDKAVNEHLACRILVVRGYNEKDEIDAFHNLLRDPSAGDRAAPHSNWAPKSKWRLHLSRTFWLLMSLRSPAVRPLHPEDHEEIHLIQSELDSLSDCQRLRDVATRIIDYTEYENGQMVAPSTIKAMFARIQGHAGVLCTNATLSCQEPYESWKNEVARGIAVDEAGKISRPDLYSVWGNTLLPCLLCGDDKQLPPVVMSLDEKDDQGKYINRLGQDGKISALLFFKGIGWPVFRLRTQLRMANGLFDLCHREVYKDLSFKYGPDCNIYLDQHASGRELEAYLQKRFPELTLPPANNLHEAFISCRGSKCHVDAVTGSKWNLIQSKHALDFVCGLVTDTKVAPAQVTILTPYRANVDFIERLRGKPEYSTISAMEPAAAVDDFQGREGNIVILVTGTTRAVGPGCTADVHQLSVMLSRHTSGLVIFGDKNVLGRLIESKSKGKISVGGKYVIVMRDKGWQHLNRATVLSNVMAMLLRRGRVAYLEASE